MTSRRPLGRFLAARPLLLQLETRDLPSFYGHQLFPLDNPWNQKIATAPVSAYSDAIIGRLVARGNRALHPDFGNPITDGALYGIPINVADATTPRVQVLIPADGYGDESDQVLVPIPANAVIEGDNPDGPAPPDDRGDSHLLVYDRSANILYETYFTSRPNETTFPDGTPHPTGNWGAFNLSVWDLKRNSFRTLGWTSADAAGLPILPGLVRPDEALPASRGGQGVIDHAIRFTVSQTRNQYVFPASHAASSLTNTDLPRMGERFRLKASFVIPSDWTPEARAVAQAMKDYGLIVADNGSDMYFQGVPSSQWEMDGMLQIQRALHASDFEVVDLTPVVSGLSVTAGALGGGTAVTIYGQNFTGAAGNLHVLFGTVEATAVTIVSDTRIDVVAPAHAAGTVDVRIQSGSTQTDSNNNPVFFGYGLSAITPADRFTFSSAISPPPSSSPPATPTSTPPPTGEVTPLLIGYPQWAVGSDRGGTLARLLNPDRSERFAGSPLADSTGGVRTAAADFTGDGVADLIVGTGPGVATLVRVLDGVTHEELFAVAPFESSFVGGVFVATGDLTGDGIPDLAISPDEGGGPRVRIYNGSGFSQLNDFFGIDDPNFRGGARTAIGDINGDRVGDLVVAAGFRGGPRLAAFDGNSVRSASSNPLKLFGDFFAFEQSLRNGVYVAVGDLNADGFADVIAGGGPGGGPRVLALSGRDLLGNTQSQLANYFAGSPTTTGGVRVAVKDLDGDRRADLLAGAGRGSGSWVRAYTGATIAPTGTPPESFALDALPGFTGGVFVG